MKKSDRDNFGSLGRIPPEIVEAPPYIVERWKRLAAEANRVYLMPNTSHKLKLAKRVASERLAILQMARGNTSEER